MQKPKTCHNACNELSMTLQLCSKIIVLKAAAMCMIVMQSLQLLTSLKKLKVVASTGSTAVPVL